MTIYLTHNMEFNNVCCLYSCAPFVTTKTLSKAYNRLHEKEFDTVLPVVPYSSPINRALRINHEKIHMIYEENLNVRSQDLEDSFYDAGQFYWCDIDKLLLNKGIFTNNTGFIIVSEIESQDIDNETDWKLAELKFQLKQ